MKWGLWRSRAFQLRCYRLGWIRTSMEAECQPNLMKSLYRILSRISQIHSLSTVRIRICFCYRKKTETLKTMLKILCYCAKFDNLAKTQKVSLLYRKSLTVGIMLSIQRSLQWKGTVFELFFIYVFVLFRWYCCIKYKCMLNKG